jgi:hypothetical protein
MVAGYPQVLEVARCRMAKLQRSLSWVTTGHFAKPLPIFRLACESPAWLASAIGPALWFISSLIAATVAAGFVWRERSLCRGLLLFLLRLA